MLWDAIWRLGTCRQLDASSTVLHAPHGLDTVNTLRTFGQTVVQYEHRGKYASLARSTPSWTTEVQVRRGKDRVHLAQGRELALWVCWCVRRLRELNGLNGAGD
jgi:hypothetical protein